MFTDTNRYIEIYQISHEKYEAYYVCAKYNKNPLYNVPNKSLYLHRGQYYMTIKANIIFIGTTMELSLRYIVKWNI